MNITVPRLTNADVKLKRTHQLYIVVNTQKNHLNETVLLSTKNICLNDGYTKNDNYFMLNSF